MTAFQQNTLRKLVEIKRWKLNWYFFPGKPPVMIVMSPWQRVISVLVKTDENRWKRTQKYDRPRDRVEKFTRVKIKHVFKLFYEVISHRMCRRSLLFYAVKWIKHSVSCSMKNRATRGHGSKAATRPLRGSIFHRTLNSMCYSLNIS